MVNVGNPTPSQQPTPTGTTPPAKRRFFWVAVAALVLIVVYHILFPSTPTAKPMKVRSDGSRDTTATENEIEASKLAAKMESDRIRNEKEREAARQKAKTQADAITKQESKSHVGAGGGNPGYRTASTVKKSAPAIVFDVSKERDTQSSFTPRIPATTTRGGLSQDPYAIARSIIHEVSAQQQPRNTADTPDEKLESMAAPIHPPREDLLKPNPDWPTTVLPENTVIEGVLKNRLEGSNEGPVDVMVTTNVYQRGTHHLVFPQGTEIAGDTKKVSLFNQERLAVTFHRALVELPDHTVYGVSLDAPALDQAGTVALHDKVNHHYFQIFGASLAVGAIGGLSNIGNSYGGSGGYDTLSTIRAGIGSEMGMAAQQIMNFYLTHSMPTIVIREGTRVKIMLTGDLRVPLYPESTEEEPQP